MSATADKTKKTAEKDKAAKPRSPILITALVAVLAAAAAGGGVWFFTQSKHEDRAGAEEERDPGPGAVLRAGPGVRGQPQWPGRRPALQLEVQLMTRDPAALEAIKTHAPAIRARC